MAKRALSADKALSPIPENLLGEPLEYLQADHFRQETMRILLGDAGARQPLVGTAEAIIDYLDTELPRHLTDEENDLFPLIDRLARDYPTLSAILDVLIDGHSQLGLMRVRMIDEIKLASKSDRWPETRRFCQSIGAFCELNRWTVMLEEKVIIPAARDHLDSASLAGISRAMSRRRDVPFPADIN